MGIRNFFRGMKIRNIDKKAMELTEMGESISGYIPYEILVNAREDVEYTRDRYERLEEMYDYQSDRLERLEEQLEDYKQKYKELRGLPFPIIYKKLRDMFWNMGITKKGKEFKQISRRIKSMKRTIKRMEKTRERYWEDLLEAEGNIDKANKKLNEIEQTINEKYKEKKQELKNTEKDRKDKEDEKNKKDEKDRKDREGEKNKKDRKDKEDEKNKKDEKDRKNKKDNWKDNMDMTIFVQNGIDVNNFEEALKRSNIDLSPKDCLLYIGILSRECSKHTYQNKEEAVRESKKLIGEIYNKIKVGDIKEWEQSVEYYMMSGMHLLKDVKETEKAKTPAEYMASQIANNYRIIEEQSKNSKSNQNRDKDTDDRTA